MLRILLATSALALTTACATTELEPIDASAFVAAKPVEHTYSHAKRMDNARR